MTLIKPRGEIFFETLSILNLKDSRNNTFIVRCLHCPSFFFPYQQNHCPLCRPNRKENNEGKTFISQWMPKMMKCIKLTRRHPHDKDGMEHSWKSTIGQKKKHSEKCLEGWVTRERLWMRNIPKWTWLASSFFLDTALLWDSWL